MLPGWEDPNTQFPRTSWIASLLAWPTHAPVGFGDTRKTVPANAGPRGGSGNVSRIMPLCMTVCNASNSTLSRSTFLTLGANMNFFRASEYSMPQPSAGVIFGGNMTSSSFFNSGCAGDHTSAVESHISVCLSAVPSGRIFCVGVHRLFVSSQTGTCPLVANFSWSQSSKSSRLILSLRYLSTAMHDGTQVSLVGSRPESE